MDSIAQPLNEEDRLELENYEFRLRRPSIYDFSEPTAEFYRWFEYGGNERPEPLTKEVLKAYISEHALVPTTKESMALTEVETARYQALNFSATLDRHPGLLNEVIAA